MRKLTSFSKAICSLALFGVACSGNDTSSGPPNTSVGGDASTGGTIASSNGGAPLGSAGTTSTTGNSTGGKAAGGATSSSGTGGNATGGATSTNIATGGAATGGAAAGGTTSNGTGGNSVGGTISTGGSVASATGTGGKATGGTTSTGGTATSSSATGGKATGGGTSSSGTGGKATGGATTTGTGGKATGGVAATGGLSSGTGGGTGVTVSSTCKVQTWPTPTGSTVTISGTKSVTNYDGGGALHEGNLNDCSIGDQSSTKAIIEVANGGSVKNVIFGKNVGDGIHCLGSCTIDNGTAASTISNSGFKGARDKILQHNGGNMTLNITNVYAEVGGKLYRSCGSGGGCTTSANHTVNVSNVVAIGVNQIVGISTNDHATLKNICTFRSPVLCNTYQVNSDNDSTAGANGTGEGPGANCSYTAADTHALVDRVGGVTLTTDVLCLGSNSVKSGSSATACITGFENCLKVCAAGMYGFKQMGCTSGSYTSSATGGCALVNSATDSAAATALAGTRAATATTSVTKNTSCSTQWALGKDSSNSANTCECVEKPGYYQQSTGSAQPATWMVWDCQSQWW